MRLVFLCGALEPGRDGVGDYTRRLAGELIRQGHDCRIVALNDRFASTCSEHFQESEGISLEVLRLNSKDSWASRIHLAEQWIHHFSPDWVSLQFVPYSFHPKGLSLLLGWRLKHLVKNAKSHVMFHETWIGFTSISPVKDRVYGFFQKHLLRNLVSLLKPNIIHTSNLLYKLQLADENLDTTILPLFSNVPIMRNGSRWIFEQLDNLGIKEHELDGWIILGIFGSIHPEFHPEKVVSDRLAEARSQGKRLALLCIGRAGSGAGTLEGSLHEKFGDVITIHFFGEETLEHVSEFIAILDYGLATMPKEFMGKSSTIAAFRAQGVPIIESRSVFLPEFDDRMKKNLIDWNLTDPNSYTVGSVSEKFICSLKSI